MRVSIAGTSLRLCPGFPSRGLSLLPRHALHGENPQTASSAYLALGLAHCFEQNESGKLNDIYVIEPIASASLECMATGAPTCFKHVMGTTLGSALEKNVSSLPDVFTDAVFCNQYEDRCEASARTWLRPYAQDSLMYGHYASYPNKLFAFFSNIVPLDQVKSDFNYNVDEKRVLNLEYEVTDEDNIKQDMSIDVYGRKEKKEAEEKAKAEAEAQSQEEEEEDLEEFLAG